MEYEMISEKELDRLLEKEQGFVIDLRSPWEYAAYHIPGAVNIPYERLKKVSPFSLFSSCLLTIILLFFPVNLFCLYPSLLCQEWMPPVRLFARYPFSAISLAATILTEPRSQ